MDADFINRNSYQVQEKDMGVCKNSGCRQVSFLSKADSKQHYRLAHGSKRGNDDSYKKVPIKFKCGICNISYLTQYRLRKHFEETGHKGVMGRPKNK